MPSSDYASAVGGGLKLKGAKEAGVKKSKKKKAKSIEAKPSDNEAADTDSAIRKALAEEEKSVDDTADKAREEDLGEFGKTEAQRRHEERRRKRLDDRLKREGIKTHKERVEELNKYLSGLSEHHDMPRIGPG